jgi:hypothetical protein
VRRIGKAIAEQVELYNALTVEQGSEESPGTPGREAGINPAASSASTQPQESDMDASEFPRPGAAGPEQGNGGAGGDVLPFRKESA